ncbi:MAG: cupin-like domain-containing protein [Rubrivivax sp.]|nr:cupin-like domain-containing protein [Rubrivivax sp.]MDP3611523.1 cupin-like domain-containing protein [Rubrivivax sp.]
MRELTGVDPRAIADDILTSTEPLLIRGLVADWPAVRAARESAQAGSAYLRSFCGDSTVGAWRGPPEIDGRFFYNHDMSGFNFQPLRMKFHAVLDELDRQHDAARPPALYVGSTTVDTCLPGFRDANDLALGDRDALMSLWIGNRTRIAAHHDLPDNLACVVAGRRRFTLFPPSELPHLYIGPLDFTPAGQAVSLVDFTRPDLEKFPKFAQALAQAQVVELQAGDAVFIPSMWWHHVEALDAFNVLVNYWWRQSPAHMDSPMNALLMAMLSVRDLPKAQRLAWQQLFEHYVFAADEHSHEHIPKPAQGGLRPLDPDAARVLRARLLKSLNR